MAKAKSKILPPVAPQKEHQINQHNTLRNDPYFWLRQRDNPEVMKYIKQENAYTDKMVAHTKALQSKIYKEVVGRLKETDLTVPYKDNGYYYYSRTKKGKQYTIFCRKKDNLKSKEQIYLDENELAKKHKYYEVGDIAISEDHRYIAFTEDTSGSESYDLRIKDSQTDKILKDKIENVSSVEWANDNKTLFYTVLDPAHRPFKLMKHKLGDPTETDILIYHEQDEAYYVGLEKTKSKKFILINLESNVTTEVWYLDADQSDSQLQLIAKRHYQIEYEVYHWHDKFLILTNDNAKNFKVIETPIAAPDKSNWKDFIPHDINIKIDDLEEFNGYLTIFQRERGLENIVIKNMTDGSSHNISFDEPAYTISPGQNVDFQSDTLRFHYQSPITSESVYDYNMKTKKRTLLKQKEVKRFNPKLYKTERIQVKTRDGQNVPVTLLYKKGLKRNGQNPCYFLGYGSYGTTYDPYFSIGSYSLVDRGFIYGIAHIRGGGELGRQWYEDGKLLKKKNTFYDFIDAAKFLISEKYTSEDKLTVSGGSAGGLLIGAVLNIEPHLFKAAVADVPFVDIVNSMSDPSIPLTVTEYDEWGNPEDKTYFEYMKSYSPYDNVEKKSYPALLVLAGLNDPRVQYWEPLKWVAKLRSMKTDQNILLLKTNMGAGHGGASGRYDAIKERAFIFAFVLDQMGINK